MFEKLAAEYYAADELSNAFLNEIQTCRERAEAVLPADTARILGETHCFHDWYLTACALNYKNHCVLTLTKGNAAYRVQISGIEPQAQPQAVRKTGGVCAYPWI